MTKTKSIDDTNALNKATKRYIPMVKPTQGAGDRTSAPNYRALTKNPTRTRADTLASQVQYGQPASERETKKQTAIPSKVSNRIPLEREKGTAALPAINLQQPLQLTVKKKEKVQATSATKSKLQPKEFKNRFDKPLTDRELAQLRLAQLQGKEQGPTLLGKLLAQTQALAT
jgi:hypothetical protein